MLGDAHRRHRRSHRRDADAHEERQTVRAGHARLLEGLPKHRSHGPRARHLRGRRLHGVHAERLLVPRRPGGDRAGVRRLPIAPVTPRPGLRDIRQLQEASTRGQSLHGRPPLRHARPQQRRSHVRGVRPAHRARALHPHGSQQTPGGRLHPPDVTRRTVQTARGAQRGGCHGTALLLCPGTSGLVRRPVDQDQVHRRGSHRTPVRAVTENVRLGGHRRDVRQGCGRGRGIETRDGGAMGEQKRRGRGHRRRRRGCHGARRQGHEERRVQLAGVGARGA
mmetsp:Transcript_288/g.1336  ORF Transcript_288/g.1336 Transcript_288/m.1336 type:complete len:279 (+) Transcript_288:248-1084(+)